MRQLVVDASAFISAVSNIESAGMASVLADGYLHAPHLVDVEVLSALRRLERHGLSPQEARESLELFESFQLKRHAHWSLSNSIWHLRHNFSAHDATYVALAQVLEVPLVTRDLRLAPAARGFVEVIDGTE